LIFLRALFLDDRCNLCREVIRIAFGLTSLDDHNVQIAIATPVEPPQRCYISHIQAHKQLSSVGGAAILSNNDMIFSRDGFTAVKVAPNVYSLCKI
jgi:hypothetical protein